MPIKSIYFDDEIYQKLSQESNISKLVNTLVVDYYKQDIKNSKLPTNKIELDKLKVKLMSDAEYIKTCEEELFKSSEEKLKEQNNQKEKELFKKNFIKSMFKELIDREMRDDEYREYIDMESRGYVQGLREFIIDILHEEITPIKEE